MNLKKKLERYLPVNLLGPGPHLIKKRIYQAAVSQRLRNTYTHAVIRDCTNDQCEWRLGKIIEVNSNVQYADFGVQSQSWV